MSLDRWKAKRVTDVRFNGRVLTLRFDGHTLRREVSVGSHVKWVGSWKSARRGTVRVDDDLHLVEGLATAVHEVVEEYLVRKRRLSEVDAHEVAEYVEAQWVRTHTNLNSAEYGRKVERVFRKEMAYHGVT